MSGGHGGGGSALALAEAVAAAELLVAAEAEGGAGDVGAGSVGADGGAATDSVDPAEEETCWASRRPQAHANSSTSAGAIVFFTSGRTP
jgi:hypothetical protein